jgi:hypothetical protein
MFRFRPSHGDPKLVNEWRKFGTFPIAECIDPVKRLHRKGGLSPQTCVVNIAETIRF